MGKPQPGHRTTDRGGKGTPTPTSPVSLELVLEAFSKSLSRARQSAAGYAANEAAFGHGGKTLYTVDHLDVELNAGLGAMAGDDGELDRVSVDFEAAPELRSWVRFRVGATALKDEGETG